jgi:hypothetical protein
MPAAFAPGDACPECMASPASHLQVLLHADQEPVLGAWCPHCALPSAAEFPITARCAHGWPMALTVPSVVACLDCQRQLGATRPEG